ncbi:MAG: adenylate/guanylate cyclase domain-containing protein [Pseudanabaenaceae cyanobacterium]
MEQIPHLIIQQEGQERIFYLANASSWKIGRAESNDIVMKDRYCSSNHAIIQNMENSFYLIDLGSMNGSFVNGKRISIPVQLKHNDQITLGMTQMRLVCPTQSSHPTKVGDVFRQPGENSTVMLQKKRLITILVIDIRNYTKLTQMLPEQTLSQVIGKWFSEAWKILQQYGSGSDKYIGDAIMAVWIHENSQEEGDAVDPREILQVLQALYDLYRVSDGLNDKFTLPFRLRIGAGINTGSAIVGQMSAGGRPEYTALGDAVNAAFRLESSTKEIGADIAMGEETFKNVPRSYLLHFERHRVPAKNYDEPLPAYMGKFADLEAYLQALEKITDRQQQPNTIEQ